MTPLTCQSCGYANEPTRVFCHQCGVRLERPTAVSEPQVTKPTPVPKRKTAAEEGAKSGSLIFSLLRILLFPAVLAIVILMLRTPTDLPIPAKANPQLTQELLERYAKAVAPSPFPRQLICTSEELNTLIATQVSIKQTGAMNTTSEESTPFLTLQQNAFTLGISIPVIGRHIVLQSQFAVDNLTPGKISVKALGGKIGSLPLPPLIAEALLRWHHGFATAYFEQLTQIQKAKQVLIGAGNVQILLPASS